MLGGWGHGGLAPLRVRLEDGPQAWEPREAAFWSWGEHGDSISCAGCGDLLVAQGSCGMQRIQRTLQGHGEPVGAWRTP